MVVDLVDGVAKIVGKVQAGYVYVDGLSVGDVTEASLKDRRILGDEGIISVFVVVDSTTGKIVGGPHIQARGSGIEDAAFAAVMPKIEEALAKSARTASREPHQLQQLVRRTVGQVGLRHLPPPPDDPSGRRRGLTRLSHAARHRRERGSPICIREPRSSTFTAPPTGSRALSAGGARTGGNRLRDSDKVGIAGKGNAKADLESVRTGNRNERI